MPTDHIRYDLLVQDALRSVVRKVLTDAARTGLPGEHHFNISFKTQAPGVVIPAAMRQRYPDEMAIILQHEFWDFAVTNEGFDVSLNFSRKPERLTILRFDHRLQRPFGSLRFQARTADAGRSEPGQARREPAPRRDANRCPLRAASRAPAAAGPPPTPGSRRAPRPRPSAAAGGRNRQGSQEIAGEID